MTCKILISQLYLFSGHLLVQVQELWCIGKFFFFPPTFLLLIHINQCHILLTNKVIFLCSGDQDSVVPFMGTRSLVNGLAEEIGLKTSEPYRTWFDGKRVNIYVLFWWPNRTFKFYLATVFSFLPFDCLGCWMDPSIWGHPYLCNCKGSGWCSSGYSTREFNGVVQSLFGRKTTSK